MLSDTVLSVRNLTKTITLHLLDEKRVHALAGVSFDVEPGEFIAVVGLSGSGKSSLLKCLYRTYLCTGGEIQYLASDGARIDLASTDDQTILRLRRDEIRYVPQFLEAPPRVSAIDVVARPLIDAGSLTADARKYAGNVLHELGIDDELSSSFPSLFSGGEKQRVNVARAVIAPARLMLLDEPTSSLDAENRERVRKQLAKLKQQGTTIVGVFHDRAILEELADRALVLESGQVTDFGRPGSVDIARFVGASVDAVHMGD